MQDSRAQSFSIGLQHVIDLLVTTDANLLVVVGQNSNHVVGVVTVADVLTFIVSPLVSTA